MKFSHLLFRAGLGLCIGLVFSFSFALFFFQPSIYETTLDRFFLIAIPALSIAYLFYETYPVWKKWLESARNIVISHYLTGFLFSAFLVYGIVGFLDEALAASFSVLLFSFISMLMLNLAAYYLVRRAHASLRVGFLRDPLNLILSLILPLLFFVVLFISAQFPSMFIWDYITIPRHLLAMYLASVIFVGVIGIVALYVFESRGYAQKIQATGLFLHITENLPGLYAGGMFFGVNLVIARALNHPAFRYNSVVFETDAGPWMTILASPASDAINRAVHPLALIIARPLMRLLGMFMGEHWNLSALLVVAFLSGLCVYMAWLFIKRATGVKSYAFIFAIFLGSTSTHLLFGSLTENYVFGMTSLIFFFLLIQSGETRLSRLVPVGVIVFGITVTNLAQTAIGLFFNKLGFWKVVRYCFLVLTLGVTLTVLTSVVYPKKLTFFFVPADLSFERNFVKPTRQSPLASAKEKLQVLTRTMFLYQVVAPEPLVVISQKKSDPFPTVDLKTFDSREHKLASYKDFANIPLGMWLMLLAGAFLALWKNIRASKHRPLLMGLLGSLGFNFLMHLAYGTELFLYTPYWVYALVFLVGLAYSEFAGKRWFESLLAGFIVILMINNLWFIFVVLRALAPFFAA